MTLRRPPPGFPEGVTFKLIVGVRRALWGLGGDVRAPNRDRTDLLTSLLGRWGKAGGRGNEVGNGGGAVFVKETRPDRGQPGVALPPGPASPISPRFQRARPQTGGGTAAGGSRRSCPDSASGSKRGCWAGGARQASCANGGRAHIIKPAGSSPKAHTVL